MIWSRCQCPNSCQAPVPQLMDMCLIDSKCLLISKLLFKSTENWRTAHRGPFEGLPAAFTQWHFTKHGKMWCLIESCAADGLHVFSIISNRKLKPLPGTGSLPSDWNVTRISVRDEISESVSLRALWAFFNWLNQAHDYSWRRTSALSLIALNEPLRTLSAVESHQKDHWRQVSVSFSSLGWGLRCVYNINKYRHLWTCVWLPKGREWWMNVGFYTQTKIQRMETWVYFIPPPVQYQQATGFCQPGADTKPRKWS